MNTRNGYRHREWDTRAGPIDIAIPKLQTGSYFPDWLLEWRRRAETGLVSVVARSYLLGVSTRQMEKLFETLGVTRLSKSKVSVMDRDLDEQVEAFRTGPLEAGPFTFVAADALVLKVRAAQSHHQCPRPARGRCNRRRTPRDPRPARHQRRRRRWLAFLRDLTARGLSGVMLITSDAHRGLVEAIGATLPGAAWQRCRTHYAANLMSATPESQRGWVKALPHSVYDQPDADTVHAQFDLVVDASGEKLPAIAEHLDTARADILAFTAFPKEIWRQIWSNNPPGTAQPRDPPPHRRRRHPPGARLADPPRWRRARRTYDQWTDGPMDVATSASTSWPRAGSPSSTATPPTMSTTRES